MVLTLAVAILWIRSIRPMKEDPRLSRGLQLLQSKISVLEDLSDRTDRQVKQLISIIEERSRDLQNKILTANDMVRAIEANMKKSLEVANIFQKQIPHEEIIERQHTQKYVLAAKMAHEGRSVEEILKQVDLPRSEVEFIAKVNKDQLMFEPELLPEWAKPDMQAVITDNAIDKVFSYSTPDLSSLDRVRSNFKEAVEKHNAEEADLMARQKALQEAQAKVVGGAKAVANQIIDSAGQAIQDTTEVIKNAQYRRIQMQKHD